MTISQPPESLPATAAVVVVDGHGRVLVVPHPRFGVSLPGGHLEPGESPLQAAVREVHEESGLVCVIVGTEPFESTRTPGAPTCAWFVARAEGEPDHGAYWCPVDELVLPFAADAARVRHAVTVLDGLPGP